ncbi:MAG: thymidine kinase, partial [Verrucomicrobiota bacterium]|nr:thymidine kinase [Verrucomicrobiota bacterium]
MAKIYFYYSAMNAGKSTTLLQSAHNYEERGMRVLVFTPKLDNRDGVGMVSSRIGLTRKATVFSEEDDLYDQVQSVQSSDKIHCI